jgi:hypothetical protein
VNLDLSANTFTSVPNDAFYNRAPHGNDPKSDYLYLTGVILPDTVTVINNDAFNRCRNIKNVSFPNVLVTIGGSAFYYCDNIVELTIPGSVTTIRDYAFTHCEALRTLTFESGSTTFTKDKSIPRDDQLWDLYNSPTGGAGTYTHPNNDADWVKAK